MDKKWYQVSLNVDYYKPLKHRAESHDRSVAAELRIILREAGVIPKPTEAKAK